MSRIELLKLSNKKIKASVKKCEAPKGNKRGGSKQGRSVIFAIRLTPEVMAEVKKAAYETHRTYSNWAECAIMWALEEGAVHTRQVVPRPGGEQ